MGVLDTLLDARLSEAFSSGTATPNAARDARRSLTPGQAKREKNARSKAGSSSSASDDEKHPRGEKGTSEGGRFVRKGSSGSEVEAVQRKVGAKQDGEFGEKTRAAVMEFQRKHGLVVDGIVGHQTAVALAGSDGKSAKAGDLKDSDRAKLRKLAERKKSKGRAPERARGGRVV